MPLCAPLAERTMRRNDLRKWEVVVGQVEVDQDVPVLGHDMAIDVKR